MSQTTEILNLDVGPTMGNVIQPQLEAVRFGPFRLAFPRDYEQRVRCLTQPERMQSSMRLAGGLCTVEERVTEPDYANGWIATAELIRDDGDCPPSILAEELIADGGMWDLCELLTLFTGRRVTVPQYQERHGAAYRHVGRGTRMFYAALHMTSQAWAHREDLVRHGLEMALLSHNQAVSDMIQTQVSHYTTALDIICAQYPVAAADGQEQAQLTRAAKRAVKAAVTASLTSVAALSPPQRESFTRILGARIDQGLAKGFFAKLQDLLVELGAIEPNPGAEVLARVRFVDTLRNAVIHTGRLPPPDQDENRRQLGQRVARIAGRVLPAINAAAFYRQLGFSAEARQQFCLDTPELRAFFTGGDLGPMIEDVSDLRILERFLTPAESDLLADDAEGAGSPASVAASTPASPQLARHLVAAVYDHEVLNRLRELVRSRAFEIHASGSLRTAEDDWFQARRELEIPVDLWL
jgi:hypothetical protein